MFAASLETASFSSFGATSVFLSPDSTAGFSSAVAAASLDVFSTAVATTSVAAASVAETG